MAAYIDWHAHHTAPEIADQIKELTGKRPHIDAYDSVDLSKRVKEMDEAGLDLQLICQGAGVYADQLPAEQALDVVKRSNQILAERIAPYQNRLIGITALSLKNIAASVAEIERTARQGFRAVLLYPHVAGEMLVDTPAMEPLFAKISELNLPIFLTWRRHGAGSESRASRRRRRGRRLRRALRWGSRRVLSAHDRQRRVRSSSEPADRHPQFRRRHPAAAASLFLET